MPDIDALCPTPDPDPLPAWTGAHDSGHRRILSGDRVRFHHSYLTHGADNTPDDVVGRVTWDADRGRWLLVNEANTQMRFELYRYAGNGTIIE